MAVGDGVDPGCCPAEVVWLHSDSVFVVKSLSFEAFMRLALTICWLYKAADGLIPEGVRCFCGIFFSDLR